MGNVILKGHISYAAKRKYRWIAEFGKNTCEKCAALDGKEFEEDEIPPRPHPNCRCKVEEISIVDEIESELNEYREEIEQLKLQADELLGDTSVLREQIEKLMKENNTPEVRTLDNRLEGIEYDVYKLIDKIEALNIDTISASVIQRIEEKIENISKTISRYISQVEIFKKEAIDNAVDKLEIIGEDAVALFRLSSSKFQKGTEYIKKNGKMYNKISEINDEKLKEDVLKKVKQQLKQNDSRGIILNKNSSLAQNVIKSPRFKNYIKDNIEKLIKNKHLPDDNLTFTPIINSNLNLFGAIHRCSIRNIRLENDLIKAEIIDTVDYNEGEMTVAIFRYLQETGQLENFYFVIELEVPLSDFIKNK